MQNEKEKFKKDFTDRLIRFSIAIIKFCGKLKESKEYKEVASQLIRSGTSIGANVIEAKASSSKRDYIKFFEIALKSANETKYWLIIIDKGCNNNQEAQRLLSEADEIAKIIGSSLLTLKGRK